jgi:hypothetical protein
METGRVPSDEARVDMDGGNDNPYLGRPGDSASGTIDSS